MITTLVSDRLNSLETVGTVWVSASFLIKLRYPVPNEVEKYQKLPNGRMKEVVHFRKCNNNH